VIVYEMKCFDFWFHNGILTKVGSGSKGGLKSRRNCLCEIDRAKSTRTRYQNSVMHFSALTTFTEKLDDDSLHNILSSGYSSYHGKIPFSIKVAYHPIPG
jgi:hypothetical protein